MAGMLDKEKEGSRGSFQKRYFVLHGEYTGLNCPPADAHLTCLSSDGWLVYYHAENQVDAAREESFSVDAVSATHRTQQRLVKYSFFTLC